MWWSCPVGSPPKRVQRNWLRLKALLEELALVQVRLWEEVQPEGRASIGRSPESPVSRAVGPALRHPLPTKRPSRDCIVSEG